MRLSCKTATISKHEIVAVLLGGGMTLIYNRPKSGPSFQKYGGVYDQQTTSL